MKAREKIENEVNEILTLKTDQWKNYLEKKGKNHHLYFHYTTLDHLQKILKDGFWKLKRADGSNDPNDHPVHAAYFTSSTISSMEMWKMYGALSVPEKIGVRIGIPQKTFLDIFTKGAWYRKDGEKFIGFSKEPTEVYDMAYLHFSSKPTGDLVFYRNYILPVNALSAKFRILEKIPECFKAAVWRSEGEIRVGHRLPDDAPDELFKKVSPEQFREMTFNLAPDCGSKLKIENELGLEDLKNYPLFHFADIIAKYGLSPLQFKFARASEAWQEKTDLKSRLQNHKNRRR